MPLSKSVTDLVAEVARICRDSGITAIDNEDYIDALNNAQDRLCELLKIFHTTTTWSTVDLTQTYDLPADYMALYGEGQERCLKYTNENEDESYVQYVTYDKVRNYDDLLTLTGTPKFFWIQDDQIWTYPTSDYSGTNNLELQYYNYVASLSGGTQRVSSDITYATATYTILSSDTNVFCSGTFTVTLPDATDNSSMEVTIKNIGTGVITMATTDSQVMDGDSAYYLNTQYEAVTWKSDGANWYMTRKV